MKHSQDILFCDQVWNSTSFVQEYCQIYVSLNLSHDALVKKVNIFQMSEKNRIQVFRSLPGQVALWGWSAGHNYGKLSCSIFLWSFDIGLFALLGIVRRARITQRSVLSHFSHVACIRNGK